MVTVRDIEELEVWMELAREGRPSPGMLQLTDEVMEFLGARRDLQELRLQKCPAAAPGRRRSRAGRTGRQRPAADRRCGVSTMEELREIRRQLRHVDEAVSQVMRRLDLEVSTMSSSQERTDRVYLASVLAEAGGRLRSVHGALWGASRKVGGDAWVVGEPLEP